MRAFNQEKAISPVLSTLLLVIIIFGVGLLLYSFVMGNIENVTGGSGIEPPTEQPFSLFVENVNINDTCITVYIRNSCSKPIAVKRVYVNNEERDFFPTRNEARIQASSSGQVFISGSFYRGARYEIKVVCTSGHSLFYMQKY